MAESQGSAPEVPEALHTDPGHAGGIIATSHSLEPKVALAEQAGGTARELLVARGPAATGAQIRHTKEAALSTDDNAGPDELGFGVSLEHSLQAVLVAGAGRDSPIKVINTLTFDTGSAAMALQPTLAVNTLDDNRSPRLLSVGSPGWPSSQELPKSHGSHWKGFVAPLQTFEDFNNFRAAYLPAKDPTVQGLKCATSSQFKMVSKPQSGSRTDQSLIQ